MDGGSSYCGCDSEIKSVSDRQCRVEGETEIFGRQAGRYGLSEREGMRGIDYFRGLLRETDEKEFGFRVIESKIIRRDPRRDESDSGLKVDYGRRDIFRNKGYEELCIISIYEVRDRKSTNK